MSFIGNYLQDIANQAIISYKEHESIKISINTLDQRLTKHLGHEIIGQRIFGSYSRGTILPHSMDENSDIDYMIIFKDNSLQSQSYLDKLRQFVASYSRSEIHQSHPTIQLLLNHIQFELVPAVIACPMHSLVPVRKMYIPAKPSTNNWIPTDPEELNKSLAMKDQASFNLIRPLIRIVKYWNVINDKIFDSYDLEKKIVSFQFRSPICLKEYFLEFMLSIRLQEWKDIVQYRFSDPAFVKKKVLQLLPMPRK